MEIIKPAAGLRAEETVLRIRGLWVSFTRRLVLSDIDCDICGPGVTVIMGPTAVGKTSFLHVVSGRHLVLKGIEVSGDVQYRGRPLGAWHRPYFLKLDSRLSALTVKQLFDPVLPFNAGAGQAGLAALLAGYGCEALMAARDTPLLQLSTEERRLAMVVRTLADPEPLVCLDEPTASISGRAAETVLAAVERARDTKTILFVTHNQAHARMVADTVMLLAGGRIWEYASAHAFFRHPATEAGRQFVETGSCDVASPGSDPRVLSAEYRRRLGLTQAPVMAPETRDPPLPAPTPPAAALPLDCPAGRGTERPLRFGRWHRAAVAASRGPEGFAWLIPGTIGGSPRPGIVRPLQHDLDALKRLKTTTLISLIETDNTDRGLLARFGLELVRFPIPDGEAPELDSAMRLTADIVRRLDNDETVTVYCRAGEGRTGTILAAFLVACGLTAEEAISAARTAKRQWISTPAQEKFIWDFELHAGLASFRPGA